MAATPISDIVATIELVRTMKETLDGLVDIVEKLGDRVERLELEKERGISDPSEAP